ncbi:MAG: rhomboid family intramembrane serine protease [Anaerolineales bacterium]|nr:rhomboid family intramembrane serine protease [Anaerolineales bacterium]
MLPLNDTEQNRYSFFPIVTVLLIIANCVVFYLEIVAFEIFSNDYNFWPFFMKYATTPRLILNAQGGGALSNITAMFLHGGIVHLVGNMLPLWVFGRRLEDACGTWRFLAFYLLAGTWAHILFVLVQSDSRIPGVGASGAIFGLMGAYLLLYPGGRIRTLVFISFVPLWPRIRAIWVVLYFVGIQIIPAVEILLKKADYSVNHWAHLGGFFSAVFIFLFLRPEAFARYISDTPV